VWPSALLYCVLAQAPSPPAAESPVVDGIVVDATGQAVADALVESVARSGCAARSRLDGTFELPCGSRPGAVRVSAPGFRTREIGVDALRAGSLRVILDPAVQAETVIVTATRTDQAGTSRATPVSVVTAEDLALAPLAPLDDALRRVPGFSRFRRSSSRVSNPTTQGVALRGLTASGASRALVLADGLVLNDPFGGWVAWTRVPQASIERVEVLRGGASDLYGADALAGVVQVLTRRPAGPMFRGEISAASRRTGRVSAFSGTLRDGWEGTLAAEAFTTRGYVLVAEDERGPVDQPAGGRYVTARAGGGYTAPRWRIRGGAHAYAEDRRNGTPLQTNDTSTVQGRLDAQGDRGTGRWRATFHAARQTYRQAFSAIAPDRSAERLTLRQRVPAAERGLSAEWSRAFRAADVLVGSDIRQTDATNHEQGYLPDGRERAPASTEAFQRTSGVFAQAVMRAADDVTVTLGLRGDLRERERSAALAEADGTVSPRVAAAWTLAPSLVVRGSAGWSYRAPTLNERFRGFRVGNIETLPNAGLRPERLRTIEGGTFYSPGPLSMRVTVYRSDLADAIANVTLETAPALILRRRENVGGVRVWGAELDGEWRLDTRTAVTAAAALTDSTFVDDRALAGLRVPQVPRWQIAGGVRWLTPFRLTTALQLRAFGSQFDDDRNTLKLDGGAVVDLTVARPLASGVSFVAGVENLLNDRYDVGRTPTRTVGQPIGFHAGVRVELGGRQ